MNKKAKTTFDKWMKDPEIKKSFNEGYKEFVLSELKRWANLMNVDYSDIPINGSFKRKLYTRIKNHVEDNK